jgi:hypothetical protein
MTNRTVIDGAGITWEIVNETTGEAVRLTPLPGGKSITSRAPARRRFFAPANTQAPADHGLPTSVRTMVALGMLEALLGQQKITADAARRWLDGAYADTPQSLRDEVFNAWDQRRMGA